MHTAGTRVRRRLAAALGTAAVVAGTLAGLAPTAAVAADQITVEGESPATSDFTPGLTAAAAASGGKFWRLYTGTVAPAGGYRASYTVDAPAAGLYTFDADTTPMSISWASPFRVEVNGQTADLTPVQYGTVTAEIKQYHYGTVLLQAGPNTVTFAVDTRRSSSPTYYTLFVDQLRFAPTTLKLSSVSSDAPLDVFQANQPVSFDLGLNGQAPGAASISYTVTDYWGATVKSGAAAIATGQKTAAAVIGTLPIGHYRIAASLDDVTIRHEFAVVADLQGRAEHADTPFAFDVAGAWLIPTERYDEVAAGLQLSGVSWIRDRSRWSDAVNPSAGTFDFSAEATANAFFSKVSDKGISVLSAFHSAPSWTRTGTDKLPDDLAAAYRYGLSAGSFYGTDVAAWELWNEADAPGTNGFSTAAESADQYSAFLKAAAIGFHDSPSKPLLADAGTAGQRRPYTDLMAQNGVLDYVDIHSYHLYSSDDGTENAPTWPGVPAHVSLVDEYGTDATLRWLTESGVTVSSVAPATLTERQQRVQARGLVENTLVALSQGTDKQFSFVLPPYNESDRYFSLLARDYSPNAAFTAETAMTQALGEARFAGAVPGVPAGVTALAFDDGADQVIALWSETAKAVALDLGAPSVQRTDIVGRSDVLDAASGIYSLTAGPDVVYLRMTGDRVVDTAPTNRPVTSASSSITPSPAQRVVASQHFADAQTANSKATGYQLAADAPTTMTVRFDNLNNQAMTGTAQASATNGWNVSIANAGLSIPAWSSVDVEVTIDPGTTAVLNAQADLTVTADFGGVKTSPSVSKIIASSTALMTSHTSDDKGADQVTVTYTNSTAAEQMIKRASIAFDGAKTKTVNVNRKVPAGTTMSVPLPAAGLASGTHTFHAALQLKDAAINPTGGSLTITDAIVDAVPADRLAGTDPTATIGDGSDLAADITLGWSADALIVTAVVTDDVQYQPFTGQDMWQGDGLQIAVAPGLPGESLSAGAEFGIGLTATGAQSVVWRTMDQRTDGTTAAVPAASRDDAARSTSYRLEIPWSELAPITPAQRLLSVSVLVNDNDGDARGFLGWGGGISSGKDSSKYNAVRLVG
ncbi:hypothetical protein IF188_10275 [Microbacterium sp. NEAU-LLC]|uniref:Carbohydrate-binding domain-containing protein n=1 Tax=Microbacterium helvum TaxID=2773713 RepID=A0ABR8NQN9_9MICO|nr:hypothetical protein [Microbacterium helvum]MBD3942082.1 hypothetical protein [Microbacterium helvum]